MAPIRTVFANDSVAASGVTLPGGLRERYDGNLSFPAAEEERPYFIANFVSTLDGVVSFNLPGQSGGDRISGANEEDRFIMGLLRASADAVMVGAGTLRATGAKATWLPESVCPAAKDLYREYRTEVRGKPEYPLVVVVTESGELDLASAVFHTPRTKVLILTTEQGKEKLKKSGSGKLEAVDVRAMGEGRLSPAAMLRLLRQEMGVELLLHEAGPTMFGEFLEGGLVDELFLTMAPQIAGRAEALPRPGLVAGVEFSPATAPWWRLVSAKNAGDHLFLRYEVRGRREG